MKNESKIVYITEINIRRYKTLLFLFIRSTRVFRRGQELRNFHRISQRNIEKSYREIKDMVISCDIDRYS